MNVLLEFFKSQQQLKGKIEFNNDIDLNNKNGLALQVPIIFNNVDMIDQEFILRVPKDKKCDFEVQTLINIFNFLDYQPLHVISSDNKTYTIIFEWDKEITYNSTNAKGSTLSLIKFKCKILERK